jgi:hypothetical protein
MTHLNHLRSSFYHQKWASITLRSPMPSPFDHPSITFDHPSPIPPIPPSVIEAPSRAHSTRLPPRCAGATQRRNPPDGPDNQTTVDEQDGRSPARLTCQAGCNRTTSRVRCIELIIRSCALASNNPHLPITARTPPSLAGESMDSFAGLDRTNTAARSQTHQRTRQGICRPCSNEPAATANADTVQTRQPATCGKARFAGISAHRPHDGKSRKGRSGNFGTASARANLTINLGKDRTVSPARGPGWRSVRSLRNAWFAGQIDRGGVAWGRKAGDLPIIDLSICYSAALSEIRENLAAAGSKNPGRP